MFQSKLGSELGPKNKALIYFILKCINHFSTETPRRVEKLKNITNKKKNIIKSILYKTTNKYKKQNEMEGK